MVIAVMVSLSPVNASSADRYFFNQALSYLASRQAQNHYYICTDAPQVVAVKAVNVSPLLVPYIHKSNLFSLWRTVKHRQLLKKLGAEVVLFFSAGLYIKSRVPYCVLVQQEETGEKPSNRLSKVLKGAKSILTLSEATKTSICQQYKVAAEKVDVVYAAAPDTPRPSGEDFQTGMKERYTESCEYFLFTGTFREQASLVNLLKAFSIFKKRQKTNWKLVMINREPKPNSQFAEALRTYKYREEVVVLQENDDLPSLLSAAYAFVYPGVQEDYGLYILEAMHFGLPVLTAHTNLINEIAGEAAIYYDGSVHDLAEKMMTLYKYEALRSQQVEKEKEVVFKFSWERTAEKIWMGCSK